MLLELLSDPKTWERFYEYKTALICPKADAARLRDFIDRQGYLPVCAALKSEERFALPKKAQISKLSADKKRTVYTYPPDENTVLKLLTFLLLRTYDGLFSDNLFSFRPGRSAKDAVRMLAGLPGVETMYAYKVDVHDYFNSVRTDLLLPILKDATADDPALFAVLRRLLEEPCVLENGVAVAEKKGIMAGTPLASFYANLFLRELDQWFFERKIPYARYSDDIIVIGDTRESVASYGARIRAFLAQKDLRVNPEKECFFSPQDGWTFLGFSFKGGVVDIAPATVKKLKQKMRRKTKALQRWRARNGLSGEKAAAAFIRIFNRKLLEQPQDNELTWSFWFFSVINTADSLRVIDQYAQSCIRVLISGTHTKARFNVRYETMKALGYQSLVHAFYRHRQAQVKEAADA